MFGYWRCNRGNCERYDVMKGFSFFFLFDGNRSKGVHIEVGYIQEFKTGDCHFWLI